MADRTHAGIAKSFCLTPSFGHAGGSPGTAAISAKVTLGGQLHTSERGHESPSRRRWLLEVNLPCRLGIGDFRCEADARIRTFGLLLPFVCRATNGRSERWAQQVDATL